MARRELTAGPKGNRMAKMRFISDDVSGSASSRCWFSSCTNWHSCSLWSRSAIDSSRCEEGALSGATTATAAMAKVKVRVHNNNNAERRMGVLVDMLK